MASSGSFEGPRNFYCHQCHSRTRVSAEEFTCASCGSGFIEEMTHDEDEANDVSDEAWDMHGGGENALFEQMFGSALMGAPGFFIRRPSPGSRSAAAGRQSRGGSVGGPEVDQGAEQMLLGDQFLRSLISNLTGVPIGGPDGRPIHFATLGPMAGGGGNHVMYGNPGDYVWGRGGFDAIVTQLLNQMEGTGPPPMTKDTIDKQVPTVNVTQHHIDEKLQCSVCWDDFKLDESVRQLDCEHIFHPDCIVPWLELHATCPVCRKPLTNEAKDAQDRLDREYNGDNGGGSGPAAPGPGPGPGGNASSDSGSHSSSGQTRPPPDNSAAANPLTDAISMVINQLMGPSQTRATAASQTLPPSNSNSNSDEQQQQQQQRQRDFQDFEPE